MPFKTWRYRLIGEEKTIPLACSRVETLKILAGWAAGAKAERKTGIGLSGSVGKLRGRITVKYRFRPYTSRAPSTYDCYYVRGSLTGQGDRCTFHYAFVYNRLVPLTMRLLGVLCLLPIILLCSVWKAGIDFPALLFVGSIALMGLFLLFYRKEKPEDASPVIALFEKDVLPLLPVGRTEKDR